MASSFQGSNNIDNGGPELSSALIAVSVVCMFLITSFTAARMVVRKHQRTFYLEDYLSLVTWVLGIAYMSLLLSTAVWGAGQHLERVHTGQQISKLSWSIEFLSCIVNVTAKTALLLQLQRIFSPSKKSFVSIITLTIIWLNIAWYLAAFVAIAVQCVPAGKIWHPATKPGRCINIGALIIATNFFNVINDTAAFILPIWAIWNLHIDLRKKLAVSAFFASGLFVVVSSVCRVVYSFTFLFSVDSTYRVAPLAIWTVTELTSIVMCTFFPLLPGFVRATKDRYKGQTSPTYHPPVKTMSLKRNAQALPAHNSIHKSNGSISVTLSYIVEEMSDDEITQSDRHFSQFR